MAVFLFWNLNRKPLIEEVVQLCSIHDVDVLILAEVNFSDSELQRQLKAKTKSVYFEEHSDFSTQKLKFFHRYSSESTFSVFDNTYGSLTVKSVRPPLGMSILVAAVHLTSKRFADDNEQSSQAQLIVKDIENVEKVVGHCRTLVIGDFNMSPFEGGLVNSDAFHSVMSQSTALKRQRVVRQTNRNYFYNPMWSRLGDGSEGPPGTYYYSSSRNREFFWHTFDQVLLRPDLLPVFKMENLKVLTEIGDIPLLRAHKIDRSFSDHLPIMIKLPIELEGL